MRFCLRNCYLHSSKGHNSKSINTRVMVLAFCMLSNVGKYLYEVSWITVLVLCTSSHVALHLCKVSWKYLKRFLSYRADTILWQRSGRTDRRPGQKQYVSQPTGGDIIKHRKTNIYQPKQDKTNKMICVSSKDRSVWAFTQSDLSSLPVRFWDTHKVHKQDWSDWTHAHIDLSLHLAQRPCCWFCPASAQTNFNLQHWLLWQHGLSLLPPPPLVSRGIVYLSPVKEKTL